MSYLLLVFKPAGRLGHAAVPAEDSVDLRHVGGRNRPAESPEVFGHLGGLAKADQRGADDRVAQGPAQGELRQSLAVFLRKRPELLEGGEVAGEMVGAEQGAE